MPPVPEPLALIPAYNEAAHISEVVRRSLRHLRSVLVGDDGSTDATADRARAAGALVVRHPANRGKGAALATGFEEARRRGFEWVLTLDGDGQHDPGHIPTFLRAAAETGADVVVGTRKADHAAMPIIRRCTNAITSTVISRLTHQTLTDTQSGYRLIRVSAWRAAAPATHSYDTESEFLIAACRRGYRAVEIPIATIYGTQQSSIHPLVDTLRFIRLAARNIARPLPRGRIA